MELYQRVPLETFIKGWQPAANAGSWRAVAVHLMYAVPSGEIDYGLDVLRQAIGAYETEKGIPPEASKRQMPFFRENRRMLVGPEAEMYMLPFYAEKEAVVNSSAGVWTETGRETAGKNPDVILTFDSGKLVQNCLEENRFLVNCKYDAQKASRLFREQLEVEYDRFFYDAEHTGFAPSSRFFSMLCNACLEVKEPRFACEREWRMALLREPQEAEYRYAEGRLIPYVPVSIPKDCLLSVELPDYRCQPLLYGALAGFLERAGLPAGQYLEGIREPS